MSAKSDAKLQLYFEPTKQLFYFYYLINKKNTSLGINQECTGDVNEVYPLLEKLFKSYFKLSLDYFEITTA